MQCYLDIIILEQDNVFTMNKLLNIVHGFISKQREEDVNFQFAISFPEWSEQKIGHILRLFSSYDGLDDFINQEPIKLYTKKRHIILNSIKIIPICSHFICFKRYRGEINFNKDIFYFKTNSKSNKNNFSIFVSRQKSSSIGKNFSSYGLSNDELGVPIF